MKGQGGRSKHLSENGQRPGGKDLDCKCLLLPLVSLSNAKFSITLPRLRLLINVDFLTPVRVSDENVL